MMGPEVKEHGVGLRGAKKYDAKTRKLVRRRVKQLNREGKSNVEAAAVMNSEGFLTPNGKPCDKSFVSNQLAHARKTHNQARDAKKKRKPYGPRKPKPVVVYDADTMKPQVAKPASTLPPSIELMLSDGQLTAGQKVELILAFQRSL